MSGAFFNLEFAFPKVPKFAADLAARDRREKTKPANVHTENRSATPGESTRRAQHRAVAAE